MFSLTLMYILTAIKNILSSWAVVDTPPLFPAPWSQGQASSRTVRFAEGVPGQSPKLLEKPCLEEQQIYISPLKQI